MILVHLMAEETVVSESEASRCQRKGPYSEIERGWVNGPYGRSFTSMVKQLAVTLSRIFNNSIKGLMYVFGEESTGI